MYKVLRSSGSSSGTEVENGTEENWAEVDMSVLFAKKNAIKEPRLSASFSGEAESTNRGASGSSSTGSLGSARRPISTPGISDQPTPKDNAASRQIASEQTPMTMNVRAREQVQSARRTTQNKPTSRDTLGISRSWITSEQTTESRQTVSEGTPLSARAQIQSSRKPTPGWSSRPTSRDRYPRELQYTGNG